jgi:PhoP regulatory network protein YrbL
MTDATTETASGSTSSGRTPSNGVRNAGAPIADTAHPHAGALLALGANRVCVIAPDDPRFCLKYERPLHERTRVGGRQALRRRLGQWLPALGDNRTELRAYRHLRRRLGAATDGVLATCHGIVDTPSGPALRCDCVRDADGVPAPSLYRCLFGEGENDRRYDADALCAAVDRMEAWLLLHRVPLFDLNSGNFAVVETQRLASGQPARLDLICIDLKSLVSGKEVLPISRWVPVLMRRKIQRRTQRLRQRIRDALALTQPRSLRING